MLHPLPKSSSKPFRYAGTRGSVLLLHGYTGSPYEVKTLGMALKAAGFACYAPLLPGHGTTPQALNKVTADQWLDAAREAFHSLPSNGPRFIVGFSMGGLLATLLAKEFSDETDGLLLFAPAYALTTIGEVAIKLSRLGLHYLVSTPNKPGGSSDVSFSQARKLNPAYRKMPIKGLIQFQHIRQKALAAIASVKCPTFIAIGENDHTVNHEAVLKIATQFQIPDLECRTFLHSWHIILLDVERTQVINDALAFIEKIYAQKKCP